jgi:hypothetical protein
MCSTQAGLHNKVSLKAHQISVSRNKLCPGGGVVYVVVIVTANVINYRGFESRHGVRFLGLCTLHAVLCNLICMIILGSYLSAINAENYFNLAPWQDVSYPGM